MADQSPQYLLSKLESLLADSAPLSVEPAHGPDYAIQMDENKKASAAHEKEIEELVAEKSCRLLEQKATKSFRILSIGGGNGSVDFHILRTVTEKLSDVKIHYIGMDIDDKSCQEAKEKLSPLRNVNTEMFVLDFEHMDVSKVDIPPCDLVLAVQVFYYMRDISKALLDALKFKKPDGHMITVIAESQSANSQLYTYFWYHEHKWPIKMSDSIVESLDSLGIKYEMEKLEGDVDITDSFKGGFTESHHKYILNWLTQTKLERYSPAVTQICIDYLSSVARGKPEQYKVPRTTAIIVC